MTSDRIVLNGVTTHNLRSVDVELPKNQLIVAAGVSGSGKSSLIIDTLFEHSKSLYLGALSSKSLDVGGGDYHFDRIAGTQPPVALRQRDGGFTNTRSTVGTLSGIDGLYRLLFGAGAHPVCPVCFEVTAADLRCATCGVFAEPLTAQHFSPNRREGKCLQCDGVGELVGFSLDKVVPDRGATLRQIWDGADSGTFAVPNCRKVFEAMAADTGIDLDVPFAALSPDEVERVLHGTDTVYSIKLSKVTNDFRFEGILGFLERAYKNASTPARRNAFANYLASEPCPGCDGGRLRPESLRATVAGHTFHDFQRAELTDAIVLLQEALADATVPATVAELARAIIKQSTNIEQVGLGHLQLQRPVVTLSGGELQRLLLAQHLASELTGVMYVLDEPTAGLHDADTDSILTSLRRLRDLGNTVIVIEHDEAVIRSADWVVELGPGAGSRGGEVVFAGTVPDLLEVEGSPTAHALLSPPPTREPVDLGAAGWLEASGLTRHNVHDQAVRLPLQALTCVSGVSGAGKSSLVAALHDQVRNGLGKGALEDVIHVAQRPIGRSSRSTLATYIGIGDHLRDAFAASPDAQERGLGRAEFSTNVAGGRCEACKGLGLAEVEMSLFRSEHVVCPECDGRRFQDHVLEVRLQERSIHDVLSMPVEEARTWFDAQGATKVARALEVLDEFGLGYLQLGSSTTTLSGGEAQRLNLASELLKQRRSGTLFIFDEPTRGLHPADIRHLLALFERLIASGNTIVAIEHNLRVIGIADWVVDVGPGAGREGGRVVHCGPPHELAQHGQSTTGAYLRKLAENPVRRGVVEQPAVRRTGTAQGPDLHELGELLPTTVAVVAGSATDADEQRRPHGLTIASLTVVSEELGLIGFMVRSGSSSWSAIAGGRPFCVNVLSEEQRDLAQSFANDRPDLRFDKLDWEPSEAGCPRIAGAFALIDCELEATYQMGDHQLVMAKVVALSVDRDRGPLLQAGFGNGRYGWKRVAPDGGTR